MTKENYIIRPYKSGDEISINDGFNKTFHLKRDIKDWEWKFKPKSNGSSIMVAVDENDKVYAHYAATRVDMQVNGRIFNCGQPVDVYAVKQKGSIQQRLYIKTVREFFKTFGNKDKIQLLFGFPSARVLRLGQLKLDYGTPIPVQVGNKRITKRKYFFKKKPDFTPCDLNNVEDLWDRACNRYPVSAVRNSEHIKQRYIDRPNNRYFFLSIENNNKMNVFSVFEYNRYSIKWIDLIWDGKNIDDLIAMDENINRITQLAGVKNNEMWLANDDEAKEVLSKRGWNFQVHDDVFLVAMSFHPELDSKKFINNLYFTLGDSDLV